MTIKDSDGGGYKWIKATVYPLDGFIELTYQITEDGAPQGRDRLDDEGVEDWTDDDVRTSVAAMLGIAEGSDEIEVIWD